MNIKSNILFFKFASSMGGGERFSFLVSKKLKEKGNRVFVFTNNRIFLKKLKKEKINCKKIFWGREVGAKRYLFEYFFLLPINIIIFSFIFIFYKKNKFNNVVFLQNLNEKIFATNLAKIFGFKVFWIEHLSAGPWLSKNFFRRSYINRSKKIDQIIVISEEIKNGLIEMGVSKDKITVVYNGVDTDEFKIFEKQTIDKEKKKLGFFKNSKIIGYVGRLHKEKGIDTLLNAFYKLTKRFDHLYLLILGDGPENKNIREKVNKLNLEKKVLLLGYKEDVPLFLNILDIFVLPSKIRESFGMVLIEAMACGKVVLGSNIGGIPEIIKDGFNGFIFNPGDENDLVEKISNIIINEKLLDNISERAQEDVKARFSLDVTIKNIEQIISK